MLMAWVSLSFRITYASDPTINKCDWKSRRVVPSGYVYGASRWIISQMWGSPESQPEAGARGDVWPSTKQSLRWACNSDFSIRLTLITNIVTISFGVYCWWTKSNKFYLFEGQPNFYIIYKVQYCETVKLNHNDQPCNNHDTLPTIVHIL